VRRGVKSEHGRSERAEVLTLWTVEREGEIREKKEVNEGEALTDWRAQREGQIRTRAKASG
jgi:hypothetical protein